VPGARTKPKPRLVHDERSAPAPSLDHFLVVCPRCRGCAIVRPRDTAPATRHGYWPHRLVCDHCGLVKESDGRSWHPGSDYGPPTDPYLGLPLWLQTPCCGRTLWVYNLPHLNYVESYVAADLRQRRWGLASRLPRWLVLRKNRDEVLRGVGRLKNALPRTSRVRSEAERADPYARAR
jgi:hypothetical protein